MKEQTSDQIEVLNRLKPGWDYGQGEAISHEVIGNLKAIVSTISDRTGLQPEVFPETDGGASISYMIGVDDFIDVTIHPHLPLSMVHEKGIGAEFETLEKLDNVNVQQICAAIIRLQKATA